MSAAFELRFVMRYLKIATGRLESSTFNGIKGLNASSETETGRALSSNSNVAIGYLPTSVARSKWRRPCPDSRLYPFQPVYGVSIGPSITRNSGLPPSGLAHNAAKVNGSMRPFAGRLKISQSRSSPRPPSEIVPVPIPPRGKATCFAPAPENVRSVRSTSAGAAEAAVFAPAAAFSSTVSAEIPRPLTAATPATADDFRNFLRFTRPTPSSDVPQRPTRWISEVEL